MSHRFKVGETVRMSSTLAARAASPHHFKIVRLLPERNGEAQYRIKSASEPHERVVAEGGLERA